MVLVVDNFKIHHSTHSLRLVNTYADRLMVYALPTCAPQLNPSELLWKHLRRKVTHNHLFASLPALTDAILNFFTELNQRPAEVLSVIGHSG